MYYLHILAIFTHLHTVHTVSINIYGVYSIIFHIYVCIYIRLFSFLIYIADISIIQMIIPADIGISQQYFCVWM